MMKNKTYFFGLWLLGLACIGCTEATETRSLVNLLLVDAPGDFDEVWVEVNGVEILPAGIRGSEENANWVSIPYQAASNMVLVSALVNDTQLLVGRTEIPAGDISKIRFLLGNVAYLISDDNRIDMTISTNSEALLEVAVDITTQSGLSYDIFLDLDLSQSVVANQNGGFDFVPSLRVFVTNGLGSIEGTVLPIANTPHIIATSENDTIGTLRADDGGFLLKGLAPDTYQIKIAASPGYQDTTFTLVNYADSTLTLSTINLRPNP